MIFKKTNRYFKAVWCLTAGSLFFLLPSVFIGCSHAVMGPACWKAGEYFYLSRDKDGKKKLFDPKGEEFYIRGIAYAPLEGDSPDYAGDLFGELSEADFSQYKGLPSAPPIRNSITGLLEDLSLIEAAGFNQIKLWNVLGLSKLRLLKPFLEAAASRKIGVMLALTGPNDGWQLSAEPAKVELFKLALAKIALEVKDIPSVISINVYAPEIRNNYPTEKTKEIIGDFSASIKSADPKRLVAVFIDRDPVYFKFPAVWTDNIDLIGIQPYSIQEHALDTARINNDVNYYLRRGNGVPVFIDEWGLRTQSISGRHSVVSRENMERRLTEFICHSESLEIMGWSYFKLRDKIWEGDFGIIRYNDYVMTKKDKYIVLRNFLVR